MGDKLRDADKPVGNPDNPCLPEGYKSQIDPRTGFLLPGTETKYGVFPEGHPSEESAEWFDWPEEERDRIILEMRAHGYCAARPRRNGIRKYKWPCRRRLYHGARRCSYHGGPRVGGTTMKKEAGSHKSRRTAEERYRHSLPGRLHRAYEEMATAPDILDPNPVLGLYDLRLTEMLREAQEKDTPQFRRGLLGLLGSFVSVWERGNPPVPEGEPDAKAEERRALDRVVEFARRGADSSQAWEEALALAGKRAQRAEAVASLMLKGEQAIPAKDLVLLMGKMMDVILQTAEKNDNKKLGVRIIDELGRTVLPRGHRGPHPQAWGGHESPVQRVPEEAG